MSKLSMEQTNHLVQSIAAGYRENRMDVSQESISQPSRKAIIEVIFILRELLFPEYYGQRQLINSTIEYHVGDLLIKLQKILHAQIVLALTYQSIAKNNPPGNTDEKADEIICRFLCQIPELRHSIELDAKAAFDGDPAAVDIDEIMFAYPGVFTISVYRLAHELQLLSVPLIPRIMTEYAHSVTGIDIHPGAAIGKSFFIDHGTGVVIGETTTIGNNVKVYQGVTLGGLSTREGQNLRGVKRHPTIEDDVTLYSGASILGGETVIGKGVVVGSNVFLTRSVPADTKVSLKTPDLIFKGSAADKSNQEDDELDI